MTETLGEIGDIIADRVAAKLVTPYDLRDWFAGMALQGITAHLGLAQSGWGTEAPDHTARHAYNLADAMIAERMKK